MKGNRKTQFTVATLAVAVASRLNDEDLDLVAAVFVQLGDTLATIAAQRARCRPEKSRPPERILIN